MLEHCQWRPRGDVIVRHFFRFRSLLPPLCIYPWVSSAMRTLMITLFWLIPRGEKALILCNYPTLTNAPRCRVKRMRAADQQHSRQALKIRDDMKSEMWRVLFPRSLQYVRQTGRNCVCLCCVIHEHIKCHLQNICHRQAYIKLILSLIMLNKCNIEVSEYMTIVPCI